jgi:hypothetical protein
MSDVEEAKRAERIRRSVQDGVCASCQKLIEGWPNKKGLGDSQLGRFCSLGCVVDMYGDEFVKKHLERLTTYG